MEKQPFLCLFEAEPFEPAKSREIQSVKRIRKKVRVPDLGKLRAKGFVSVSAVDEKRCDAKLFSFSFRPF